MWRAYSNDRIEERHRMGQTHAPQAQLQLPLLGWEGWVVGGVGAALNPGKKADTGWP